MLTGQRHAWADASSALFWLDRRGWPALEVAGQSIAGAEAWRRWVSAASLTDLLSVRDRLAAGVGA